MDTAQGSRVGLWRGGVTGNARGGGQLLPAIVAALLLLVVGSPLRAQTPAGPPAQLAGHSSSVNASIYTGDQAFVVTAGADQLIKLWDPLTGNIVRTLAGHTAQVTSLAVSPDQAFLVSGAADNTLRLWDVPRTKPLQAFPGHTAAVRGLAVNPNGQWFVSASDDRSARIVSLTDGVLAFRLDGHAAEVLAAAVRGDSGQVATGDAQGIVRLWSPLDGQPQGKLGAHAGKVNSLIFPPGNQQLISCGDDGLVRVWQLPVVPPRALASHPSAVRGVAVTSDGQFAVTGDEQTVRVIQVASGQTVRELPGQVGAVRGVAISPNNALAASASEAGVVRVVEPERRGRAWDRAGSRRASERRGVSSRQRTVRHGWRGWDDSPLVAAGETAGVRGRSGAGHQGGGQPRWAAGRVPRPSGGRPAILIRDAQTGARLAELLGHEAAISSLAFSADQRRLVSGSADKTARVWDLADNKFPELMKLAHPVEVTAVAFNADASQVITGAADSVIRQWKLAQPAEAKPLAGHSGAVTSLQAAAAALVSASADGTVRVWNVDAGSAARTLTHGKPVTLLAVSPDGARIASLGNDNVAKLWTAAANEPAATWSLGNLPVAALAVSSDGRLATGSTDGVRTWDLAGRQLEFFPTAATATPAATGTPAATPVVGVGLVPGEAAGPSIARIVAAGADLSVRVFQPALARLISGHEGPVTSVAFTPDGNSLISGGADKTVRVWNLADGTQVRTLAGSTGAVQRVAVTANGTRVLAGSADGGVRVWNMADGGSPDDLYAPRRGPLPVSQSGRRTGRRRRR